MHKVLLLIVCALVLSACGTTIQLGGRADIGGVFQPSPRDAAILRAQAEGRLKGPPFTRDRCNNPPRVAPPRGTFWQQQAIYDWDGNRICRYVPRPKIRDRGYRDRWHNRGSHHY